MVDQWKEGLLFQLREKLDKGSLRLIHDMVQSKELLLKNEFMKDMSAQKRDHLHKERKERILAIIRENAACPDMMEALQLFLYAHEFGIDHGAIEALRAKLMPGVTEMLNKRAVRRDSDEILAAAVIRLRAF